MIEWGDDERPKRVRQLTHRPSGEERAQGLQFERRAAGITKEVNWKQWAERSWTVIHGSDLVTGDKIVHLRDEASVVAAAYLKLQAR